MPDITNIMALGILIGIAVLALKTAIGCGFASLKRREILYIASLYFILSIVMGYLVGVIPVDTTQNILASGLAMHLIIAIGLIYFGVHTKKEWLSGGCDLSRKSFLWLSCPCPVCLTATFLACMTLANVTGVSNFIIGVMVGTIFFFCICFDSFAISSIARRFNLKNPSALGTVMILFGLFYLLSPLIIPAYLQAQTLPNSGFSINLRDTALSFSLMSLLITLGFVRDRYGRLKYKGGKKTKWTYLRE